MKVQRRLPIGAEVQAKGGVHFRVWAPKCRELSIVLRDEKGREEAESFPLHREEKGYFSTFIAKARPGTRYAFRQENATLPDPASRYQPEGPHGFSEVVDAVAYEWSDGAWRGLSLSHQVLYETHIGTFTREGTWVAARRELPRLRELGVTCLNVMPIAEFDGAFGWGYDGVDLFAPYHRYGSPDDLRDFIAEAHRLELGVLLDVVYNHLGPSGNYLREFSGDYFSTRYSTEWGEPLNFDGPSSESVREFVLANARYWIEEFHFDGFRVDATQSLFDESEKHILLELGQAARAAAGARRILLIAENETQDVRLVGDPLRGGYGCDALWNDDFHHAWRVALTGRREAYYRDYRGSAIELAALPQMGFLYQGQRNARQAKPRGTHSADLAPERFVTYLQNHDQVANSADGRRLHLLTSPSAFRAATAAWLLQPMTPMLFQGQEFGASSPFLYFADHEPRLAALVEQGRRDFLAQFGSLGDGVSELQTIEPHDPRTFERSRLDFADRDRHALTYALHRDLLRLRRDDRLLGGQGPLRIVSGVISPQAWALRLSKDLSERLLVVNLGPELIPADVHPNPILAPPHSGAWELLFTSEMPDYGGSGVAAADAYGEWSYAGFSTYFFSGEAPI